MRKSVLFFCFAMQATITRAQPDYPAAPPPAGDIIRMEYFVDTDPGIGNGIPVVFTPSQIIGNLTFNADISGLSSGFHRFYLRSMDASGKWSLANSAYFDNYIVPVYSAPAPVVDIIAAEYFIDTDPGFGNGSAIAINAGTDISNQTVAVNVTGLSSGTHRLYIRTKDANNKWSLTNTVVFDNTNVPSYPTAAPISNVSFMEYFIDTDPGFGNGNPIAVSSAANIADLSVNIPLNGLSQGHHTLYVRSRQNPWSLNAYADFMVTTALPVTWLFVKAEAKTEGAIISWATGSEQNVQSFVIEYSSNGTVFTTAGQVQATGNAAGSSYSYKHTGTFSGVAYYRIKQVDNNGASSYSKTIALLFQNKLQSAVLFPNPANQIINIALPLQQHVKSLRIYDSGGRLIKSMQVSGTQSVLSIPVNGLSKGQYRVIIETNKGQTTLPFLKQ
jgi:hypothetical protein